MAWITFPCFLPPMSNDAQANVFVSSRPWFIDKVLLPQKRRLSNVRAVFYRMSHNTKCILLSLSHQSCKGLSVFWIARILSGFKSHVSLFIQTVAWIAHRSYAPIIFLRISTMPPSQCDGHLFIPLHNRGGWHPCRLCEKDPAWQNVFKMIFVSSSLLPTWGCCWYCRCDNSVS